MLPTPAPTTPRSSPPPPSSQLPQSQYPDADNYPEAPQNRGSAPFSVLSGLFDKLQNERKPDKRRKYMSAWFDVRPMFIIWQARPLRGEMRLAMA
jgi:DNA ligase-4